jgi:hypothetical protein
MLSTPAAYLLQANDVINKKFWEELNAARCLKFFNLGLYGATALKSWRPQFNAGYINY